MSSVSCWWQIYMFLWKYSLILFIVFFSYIIFFFFFLLFFYLCYLVSYCLFCCLMWVSDYCLKSNEQFFSYIMAIISYILTRRWWYLLCIRPARWIGFYRASSLKQQSAGRHVAPLGHMILFPVQPVFALPL